MKCNQLFYSNIQLMFRTKAPPKNPISILNPFTKKPRRRRKGGALEDDEEWVMIDFVDLGKVKVIHYSFSDL